ncbi:MAG TPA: ATP-binding protein [Candidatus Aquilonibacter sp.]|nr:ATP-binding protein [Candidatus Aquilonibacter sp.]
MRLWPKRVRAKLTLWYVGVLILILAAYLGGVSALLFWRMSDVLKRLGAEDLETVKGLLYFEPNGTVGLREDYHHHTDWKQVRERLLEILAPDGQILYRNEELGDRTMGGAPFAGEGENGYSGRRAEISDGTHIILISRVYDLQGKPILIRVGYRQDLIWDELKETMLVLMIVLPFVLAGTAYAGYRMVGRALDPIGKMASRAEQINSERLNERLPETNPQDELGHLARVFNAMLSRIEQSFEQLRRFTADASHELRTPLAAIRSIGEVELQKDPSAAEYRDTIGSMLEEVNRLTAIVENLLVLSRADSGQIAMHATDFRLAVLAREAAALLEVLIQDKDISFELRGDENACVHGDRLYLRHAVINVLHNAMKFTPAGGTIRAEIVRKDDSRVELDIIDSGPGIPPEHAARIFERFYRVDETRASESAGGAGLGLAIAMWAVEANGGEMGVRNSKTGGALFWMKLIPAQSAV